MSLKLNSCNSLKLVQFSRLRTWRSDEEGSLFYFILFYYFATQTKRRKYFVFRRLQ